MGKIKERFINILHIIIGEEKETLDEDGNMNIDAFKDEDPNVMAQLSRTSGNVDKTGSEMFLDRADQRKETLRKMRATLDEENAKPNGAEKNSKPIEQGDLEQEDLEK